MSAHWISTYLPETHALLNAAIDGDQETVLARAAEYREAVRLSHVLGCVAGWFKALHHAGCAAQIRRGDHVYLKLHCVGEPLPRGLGKRIKAARGYYSECRGFDNHVREVKIPVTEEVLAAEIVEKLGLSKRWGAPVRIEWPWRLMGNYTGRDVRTDTVDAALASFRKATGQEASP